VKMISKPTMLFLKKNDTKNFQSGKLKQFVRDARLSVGEEPAKAVRPGRPTFSRGRADYPIFQSKTISEEEEGKCK